MNESRSAAPRSRTAVFAWFSIVLGVVGWIGSWELATEYVKKIKDPEYVPNCDISPVVTCGPNMDSWQGSLFGFSNTFIGLAAFMAPILVGFALLAGARFAAWFWWVYLAGITGGFAFILWLSYQSVFVIGTMCPWCMVVWAAMIPLFWTTLLRSFAHGDVPLPDSLHGFAQEAYSWTWVLIVLTYIYIATIAQIALDWIGFVF